MNTYETPIQLSMPLTPWAQLVTPVLVARTVARRARPIVEKFLRRYPTPTAYLERRASAPALVVLHVHTMLEPLGLASVRTAAVDAIAFKLGTGREWVIGRAEILAIPGCGRYVADSFDLFYRGNLDCDPADPILIAYRDATRRRFADVRTRTYEAFTASRCLECEDDDGGSEFGLALDPDQMPR